MLTANEIIDEWVKSFFEDHLEHHGIKGQKWGVRRSRAENLHGLVSSTITRKTKEGHTLTISPDPPNKFVKLMAAASGRYAKNYEKTSYLSIHDEHGKKIGHASLWLRGKEKNKELYLNWIEIDKSARGKGYATTILKAAEIHGKKMGLKRMVLDVPGRAPDAEHIYSKMGFKPTGKRSGNSKDMWGGLTEMEYRFSVKHTAEIIDDILKHHGIKGMKWGVRSARPSAVVVSDKRRRIKTSGGFNRPAHSDAIQARTVSQIGKKSGLKSLSNAELIAFNNRLNLEQQAKRLTFNDKSPPKKFVLTLLGQTGKQQASEVANTAASTQVKKLLTKVS